MDYVEKVVNSTAETSFLAGSEAVSQVLVEHFYSAATLVSMLGKFMLVHC